MKFLVFIIICLFAIEIFPQELSKEQLDSLYNLFTYTRGVNPSETIKLRIESNPEIIKCGLGLVNSIKQNLKYFSPEQQAVLSKLLVKPTAQKSVVSPNGFFRVHYDTSGYNAIGYDLNLFLQALDSVYNFEVTYLGYPPPPSDGIEGGDSKYDFYIENLGNLYGYTTSSNKVGTSQWTSFINIDNDFGSNFYTQGIDAARVTAAHEFHHAIQMGNYAPIDDANAFRESDRYFCELTSTAFEEFVFDDVNDYYAYMPTYFNYPDNSLVTYVGYDVAIWNIYLQRRFGFDLLKNQWELIPTSQAIKAIALSLNNIGTTLGNEQNRFGIWSYFTNSRNYFPNLYFEEASSYPLLKTTAIVNFNSLVQTYNMSLNPCANYFLKINILPTSDEFVTIVTNSEWQKAIDSASQFLDFSFTIYRDTTSGMELISDKYSVTLNHGGDTFWNNSGIMNNSVVYGDSNYIIPSIDGDTYAFPTPFNLSSSPYLKIDFSFDKLIESDVDLNIYSSGLELVYSGKKFLEAIYIKDSKWYFRIGLNNSEINNFPSGVYIYAIKSGKEIWKGKLVIFND